MSDISLPRHEAMEDMLELARDILRDGLVTDAEARRFHTWTSNHKDLLGHPVVERFVAHLGGVFADGRVSAQERANLTALLRELTGDAPGGADPSHN